MNKGLLTASLMAGVLTLGLTGCGSSSTTYDYLDGSNDFENSADYPSSTLKSPYEMVKENSSKTSSSQYAPQSLIGMYDSGSSSFEYPTDTMDELGLLLYNDGTCIFSKEYGGSNDTDDTYDCSYQFVDSKQQIVISYLEEQYSTVRSQKVFTFGDRFDVPYNSYYRIESDGINYTALGY